MEIALEIVFEVLLELVFSVIGEAMLKRAHRPVVGALGALMIGALVGIASTWLWPQPFIASQTARMVNLVFAPVFVGGLLGMRGYLKEPARFLVSSAVNGVLLAGIIGGIRFFAL